MVRPRNQRRIAQCPKFNINSKKIPIRIKIEEIESIRLTDYNNINQIEAAKMMNVSQSTFNRILTSARKLIATSIIENKDLVIIGDDYITKDLKYLCKECNFQWSNPNQKYDKCPNCNSKNIITFKGYLNEENSKNSNEKCKCPKCGYEDTKITGIPCRDKICPSCGSNLVGSGRCNKKNIRKC